MIIEIKSLIYHKDELYLILKKMMNEALLRESLNKSFNSNINLRLVKPNTYQIFLPYFHSDGDMVDIFIQFV
nr:MAG TPA: hypothetical protein [Caudoviricetes sp.]